MKSTDSNRHGIKPGAKQISVRNLQRTFAVNVTALQEFGRRALRLCSRLKSQKRNGGRFPDEIVVLLISERRMAALHRRFLNKPGSTDVITFQHGEIFISVSTARQHARQFGTSTAREMQLYIVHGLLHLLGYDDQTSGQRERMRAAETTVIRRTMGLK